MGYWGTGVCPRSAVRKGLSRSRASIKVQVGEEGYPHQRRKGPAGSVAVMLGVPKAEALAGGRMWEKQLVGPRGSPR